MDLTLCLQSCGELTEPECLAAIEPRKFAFQEVRNVTPAVRALNQMLDRCRTRWLVPLDADMVLYPDFLGRIEGEIHRDPKVHTILFSLYDTFTETKIMALKVFNMEIVKRFPFVDTPCPDVQHYRDLSRAGHATLDLTDQPPIGDHVLRGEYFCHAKYRDLFRTCRAYPDLIHEFQFKGGTDIRSRAKGLFDYFKAKYQITRKTDYLAAIAGMTEGLSDRSPGKSKDLTEPVSVAPEHAEVRFLEWYRRGLIL